MALGFQWTKYCSWDVGICHHLEHLPSFGSDLLPVSYLVNAVVKLKHLVVTLDAPHLFASFFAYSFL